MSATPPGSSPPPHGQPDTPPNPPPDPPLVASPGRPELDDRPPLLGSWRNLYLLVLGVLVALIVFFTVLTRVYA